MPDSMDDFAIVHLIAQPYWHMPAFVVGNRAGLTAVRDAIDAALSETASEAEVMCSDGEGYGIHVRCVPSSEMDAIPLGYTDRETCPTKQDDWPSWMLAAL